MDARPRTVRDILHAGDQYLVPFFQRHYSWKLVHWERLWDDIVAVVRAANQKTQHFMGPLICTPFEIVAAEIPSYQLIDGQQRLTTLTVLLAALRDVARENKLEDLATRIEEDYLIHRRETGLKRYKLVPRVADRSVLFAVVDHQQDGSQSRRDGIVRAYRYFLSAIREFCKSSPAEKLRELLAAATSRLSLVMVTIDNENPYDIFDSLNTTGLPLEQSDMIRNFMFMCVPMAEQQEFNEKHWQPFESVFEDQPAASPTLFYRDYLMRDGQFSDKGKTFADFKEAFKARKVSPAELVTELKRYARFELMIRNPATCSDPVIANALNRLGQQKMTTAYPLVLNLLARLDKGELSQSEFVGCLTDLQSFALRRLVCGESGKPYGEWFCEAIKFLAQQPRQNLQTYLLRRGWPDDKSFIPAMRDFAIYRRDPSKCRAILETLEQNAGHKEQAELTKLTIEHVMPQTIRDDGRGRAWQEMLGADWRDVYERYLDTIGNLTLTGYNTELSNDRFDKKQAAFKKSHVELNGHFVDLPAWDAKSILRRGQELSEQIARIWARPDSPDHQWRQSEGDNLFLAGDDEEADEGDWTYSEYWNAFMTVLAARDGDLQPKSLHEKSYLDFPSSRGATGFSTFTDEDEGQVGVELWFRGKYALMSLHILQQDAAAINAELSLGDNLEWIDDDKPVRAVAYLDAARLNDRADWQRQHEWLAKTLLRMVAVMTPRLVYEIERAERKSLEREFWREFESLLQRESVDGLFDFTVLKPADWREYKLSRCCLLWAQLCVEELCVGVGLMFKTRRGFAVYDEVVKQTADLQKSLKLPVDPEEDSDSRFLGTYRFARLHDRATWLDLFQWMADAINAYTDYYKAVVTAAEAEAESERQTAGAAK